MRFSSISHQIHCTKSNEYVVLKLIFLWVIYFSMPRWAVGNLPTLAFEITWKLWFVLLNMRKKHLIFCKELHREVERVIIAHEFIRNCKPQGNYINKNNNKPYPGVWAEKLRSLNKIRVWISNLPWNSQLLFKCDLLAS